MRVSSVGTAFRSDAKTDASSECCNEQISHLLTPALTRMESTLKQLEADDGMANCRRVLVSCKLYSSELEAESV